MASKTFDTQSATNVSMCAHRCKLLYFVVFFVYFHLEFVENFTDLVIRKRLTDILSVNITAD